MCNREGRAHDDLQHRLRFYLGGLCLLCLDCLSLLSSCSLRLKPSIGTPCMLVIVVGMCPPTRLTY